MRSKNLLPVQVVVPSSLMGSSQSMHKAAFEEALHNSIETSLRSAAVAPSTIFSSLFFSFRPSSSNSSSEQSDVKPNAEELDIEINRQSTERPQFPPNNQNAESSIQSSSYKHLHSSTVSFADSDPPALLSATASQAQLLSESNNSTTAGRQVSVAASHSQIPFIAQQQQQQQQQLEQIKQARTEQLKHLQRLQAWQQLQNSPVAPHPLLKLPSVSEQSGLPIRKTAVTGLGSPNNPGVPPNSLNGVQPNGKIQQLRPTFTGKQTFSRTGFCKFGKDIRLSSLEHDCSKMAPYPSDFALLALQPTLSADDVNIIVIAINLRSLPTPGNFSQALSVQCIGCGEKPIHMFSQLAEHICLETAVDPLNTRLNSSQLIGPHARFYLIRDPTNSKRLIRGPPVRWNTLQEGQSNLLIDSRVERKMGSASLPRFPVMNSNTRPLSYIRGNLTMMNTSPQTGINSTHLQNTVSLSPQRRSTAVRPYLRRTLSGPIQNKSPEPAKRQLTSISQDEMLEISDDPPPKRYLLNEEDVLRIVKVPSDLCSSIQRKPVVAFLVPGYDLPQFSDEASNLVVTNRFIECFKETTKNNGGNSNEKNSLYRGLMLLATLQYLIRLRSKGFFLVEGLSCAVMRAKEKLLSEHHSSLKEMKAEGILAVAKIVAAASNGVVDLVTSKVSAADSIAQCLAKIKSSSSRYYVCVFYDAIKDDLQFHLVIADKWQCRSVAERLLSVNEMSSSISQGLVSLAFTQLRMSLSDCEVLANYFCNTSPSKFSSLLHHNHQHFVKPHRRCSVARKRNLKSATTLLEMVERIFQEQSNVNLSDFTSLRFVFLLPSNTALLSQTVRVISDTDVLMELHKTSLPVSGTSSQVIVTMETSSKQKLISICKRWEDTSTLLVLLHIDAHSTLNSAEMCNILNSQSVLSSRNILTIQCSSSPYSLLTDRSRIPLNNFLCPHQRNCDRTDPSASFLFGTSIGCFTSISTTYDPKYELMKSRLLGSNYLLHTSLVACELLTQQYNISLITSSATEVQKHELQGIFNDSSSPLIDQVVRDLLGSSKTPQGITVIVRINSSVLATRFYDTLKQTREKMNLDRTFEVVLYSDTGREISLSPYFLEILQNRRNESSDWFPESISDLAGIPCLVIYEGSEIVSQMMPWTLKYVDLRMAFEGCGVLYRSNIEKEMALAASLCAQNFHKPAHGSSKRKNSSGDEELQIIEHGERDTLTDTAWINSEEEKKEREDARKPSPSKVSSYSSQCRGGGAAVDFISLAMQEADLLSENQSKEEIHYTPTAIVPDYIHNVINYDKQVDDSVCDFPPHSLCKWTDLMHPQLTPECTSDQLASFYRQWTTPTEDNRDFSNQTTSHELSKSKRILLASPNYQSIETCCHFLKLLHRTLIKMLEISVYNDPEDEDDLKMIPATSFRSLLFNSKRRGLSQVINLCRDPVKVEVYISTDEGNTQREVVTKLSKSLRSNEQTRSKGNRSNETELKTTHSSMEYVVRCAPSCGPHVNGLYLRVVVPFESSKHFSFTSGDDGNLELVSLRLKRKFQNEESIKTPVVSLGLHGAERGLYNLCSSASSTSSGVIHFIVVQDRDAELYKKLLVDHVLVILPIEFDHLGKGAMKFAAQVLFHHFYLTECKAAPEDVWPFVLFINDDIASWSKWKTDRSANSVSDVVDDAWTDVTLCEMLESVESSLSHDIAAAGFRPWSSNLTMNGLTTNSESNYLSASCVESCFFLNLKLTNQVMFAHTRFDNEDIDWSLRAAASGLKLFRFENVTIATKVMAQASSYAELNQATNLVIAADSDFDPLPYHPAFLLEQYFSRYSSVVFPASFNNSSHPVLCVDCYLSLGTKVCVQFASSNSTSSQLSFDYERQYGGLILHCVDSTLRAESLKRLEFASGAVVCVIANDRNSLRHLLVNLDLESNWHFRITDEFQTANFLTLDGARVRPLYFLTGVKKNRDSSS